MNRDMTTYAARKDRAIQIARNTGKPHIYRLVGSWGYQNQRCGGLALLTWWDVSNPEADAWCDAMQRRERNGRAPAMRRVS